MKTTNERIRENDVRLKITATDTHHYQCAVHSIHAADRDGRIATTQWNERSKKKNKNKNRSNNNKNVCNHDTVQQIQMQDRDAKLVLYTHSEYT